MLKKTITIENFDGVMITEDHYFHYSQSELMAMNLTTEGGLEKKIRKISNAKDQPELFKLFEDLILGAYGEKSADGRYFVKEKTINGEKIKLSDLFRFSPAYDEIFSELIGDEKAAAEFVNGIIPAKLNKQLEKYKDSEGNIQIDAIKNAQLEESKLTEA